MKDRPAHVVRPTFPTRAVELLMGSFGREQTPTWGSWLVQARFDPDIANGKSGCQPNCNTLRVACRTSSSINFL